jgi:aromatic ring hydroxylase
MRALAIISIAISAGYCRRIFFHVSANTDPKGDRSKRLQDQDPDMMVHVAKETDAGIVLRGAKY